MQRPKLEIASWIAGIVGAAAAIVALAYQFVQPSQGISVPNGAAQTAPPAQPERAGSEAIAESTAPVSGYRHSLRLGLEAAKRLNSYKEREDAILRIVRAAIRDDHYVLAYEASRSLIAYTSRDAVAVAVSCHLAHRAEYDAARDVAISINDSRARDKSLSLITELAATKPGQGENDYSCGEA